MSEPSAPQTSLAGDVDVALDSFGLEAQSLTEPSAPRTGASASPPAVAGEGIRVADVGAEFLSEETLPARPPRQTRDEAALDAFENETSFSATSYIPSAPPPTVTAPAAAPRGQRIAFRSTWPAIAASVVLAGGTALGLWWQAAGNPPPRVEASVGPTSAPPPESRPSAPASAPVSPTSASAASAVEPLHEARSPAEKAEPEATREVPDPVDADASGNVQASSRLTAETGIGDVLPQPDPAPEISALAPLTPPAIRGDVDDGTLPGRRAGDSPPPVAAAEPPPPSAESLVVAVLGQYQSAYSRLDAASVLEIWPSVDIERLERAFRNLDWQDLEFNSCRVNVAGATALATCTGVAEFTTRVGNRSARDARSWTFSLKRESDRWLIQAVQMR